MSQASEKLRELKEAFHGVKKNAGGLQLTEMADALFARAPLPFLQRSSVKKLREIAHQSTEQYNEFLPQAQAGKTRFAVHTYQPAADSERANHSVLTVLIDDRPFVVDSLLEVLRTQDLKVEVILHPILGGNGTPAISFVYFEIERLDEPNRLESIQAAFVRTLDDLLLVTGDYEALRERLDGIAREFSSTTKSGVDFRELSQLASWLSDGGFVLLGSAEFKVSSGNTPPEVVKASHLGLFRQSEHRYIGLLNELERDAANTATSGTHFGFSKTLGESPVHRCAFMDVVSFVKPSTGTVVVFVGLLTSRAIAQEASSIPFIRKKLATILELEEVRPNSYDYKEIVSIVDSMPKYELFTAPFDALRREINIIQSIQQRGNSRVSVHVDQFQRFLLFMVAMPRERFASGLRLRIQNMLEDYFHIPAGRTEHKLAVSTDPLARIYFTLPVPRLAEREIEEAELERKTQELTLSWDDDILSLLEKTGEKSIVRRFREFYAKALPAQYKAATQPAEAREDLRVLEKLEGVDSVEFEFIPSVDETRPARLKIYKRGGGLTLSAILPLLENSGLEILNESATNIIQGGTNWATLYAFEITTASGRPIDEKIAREIYLPGLKQVVTGRADNDRLNGLLIDPGVSLEGIAILRVLQRYLWQIKAATTPAAIVSAIVKNPQIAQTIIEYFETKFDPRRFAGEASDSTTPTAERLSQLEVVKNRFLTELKNVGELDDDRVLRSLFNVVEATVRTNAYRNANSQRLALKIECKKITAMPAPRPFFEIFISAPDFEGVHLRGGKVARGGLRWSERPDDYRTEVLGLMKTQMVKNSIIVPVGAKGGFIVKRTPNPESVKACYQLYIRSLLEVSDNLSDGKVIHPERVLRYDADDPYLVVAADKGTATFSDIANAIAVKEFDFWLGDAFASGGSAGYSHKELAITARGAWEAVCQHFRELGIDIATHPFTAVGIGDMSGDVFGNGLLLSRNFKLVAAFDHRHIFIDPTPDTEKSFAERKRLFDLPRSSWDDYDRSLISAGGGVFPRREKEIPISPEAQKALGIEESVLSGQELMRAILKAPVDLLWNGGIGTYVKSSAETHLQVGDRANDDVRVDATDLRVKVVGEGGNLGFTQLARIEYSKLGGRCNTDAVDNSGGVDLSDHEVNFKILLQAPLRKKEITEEERREILRQNAEEVCQMVVHRNRQQAKIISLGVYRSRKNLDYYKGLIRSLEARGALDRKVEFLPDDEQLSKRASLKAGLTRPEIAVVMSYMKMQVRETIIRSSLPDEPFLQRYLTSYFPKKAVERFPEYVREHPLRKEIICTQVANSVIEHMGVTFVYRTAEETGAPSDAIISAFLAAASIVDADKLVAELEVMNRPLLTSAHQKGLLSVGRALDSMTRWILEHRNESLTWQELVERYSMPFKILTTKTESFLSEIELRRYFESKAKFVEMGFSDEHASVMGSLVYAASLLDIVEISRSQGEDVLKVAKLYDALATEFQLTNLLEKIVAIEFTDRWESLALRALTAQLRGSVGNITRKILELNENATLETVHQYLNEQPEILQRFNASVREFQNRTLTIPALMVIANQMTALARGRRS